MSYRPSRKLSLWSAAACALSLAATGAVAQTTGQANPSRQDIFLGYSYFGAHGQVKPAGIKYSSVNAGVAGSYAYYFNKYVGAEGLVFVNPGASDGVPTPNDGLFGIYGGPIFRAPMGNYTLFAHGLVGGTRLAGPNSDVPATYEHEPYRWGVGLVAGGGLDYDLPFMDHRFGLRVFEADYRYQHVNFGPAVTVPTPGNLGGIANLSGAELSTGLLLHIGHILPPTPVAYTCAVTAPTGTIYPGDAVTVTGTAANLDAKKTATYTWSSDGGAVSGSSNVASLSPANAGTYTVKGHVTQGDKPWQSADCSVPVTVTDFAPPSVTCSASPSTVDPNGSSTITANGVSPQNRPLTYSYSATAGTIAGSDSTTTLSTTGANPGVITVTCNVMDDKGKSASATTTVTVNTPPPPAVAPKVMSQDLCSISFDRDKKRPARVDNEAKACLDDISKTAQRDPQAKLAVIGNADPKDKQATKLAAQRAVNEKAYLVSGEGQSGIDASRISVYTGNAGTNTAATVIIPVGADFSTAGLTPVDESKVKPVARTAAPAKHHKKK